MQECKDSKAWYYRLLDARQFKIGRVGSPKTRRHYFPVLLLRTGIQSHLVYGDRLEKQVRMPYWMCSLVWLLCWVIIAFELRNPLNYVRTCSIWYCYMPLHCAWFPNFLVEALSLNLTYCFIKCFSIVDGVWFLVILISNLSNVVKYECACGILDVAGTFGVKFEQSIW